MNENESIEFKENYTEKNILCRNKKWQTIKNSNLALRLILKFEQKYKHLDGYTEYAHLLLCQLNIV